MKLLILSAALATGLMATACTSSGATERGAAGGALLGAAAGAIIGNNTGSGDAGQGAAIGAATGAIAGGVAGAASDRNRNDGGSYSQNRGPNGEEMIYDNRASRYYYVDRRSGRTYWANGEYRG
ncbi:MAG: hypothetical protein EON93_02570 [Burkholderiales bacterium]|nr:MAG: hypothetical protein EON93_02570 [Burkholderiales bacterium]